MAASRSPAGPTDPSLPTLTEREVRALFWLRHPSPEDVPALDTVARLMRLGLAEFVDGNARISGRGHTVLETEYDFFRLLDPSRR